ncbi:hypothetical protein EXT57_00925 [Pectobacterium brasiliense]|uniref:hypothetical protein n=1 Tax=Pectobacterium brasiliense TaxID=180957 RepID=UPI00202D93F6|nr:hypothetical protein [Pectobacterium brasiliense]MCL6375938.1 hypothetical protein [Pectobacterium brasiliense]
MKRAKIESLYIIVSSLGHVYGIGNDACSAWRDAVDRSGVYTNAKDMMLTGNFASVEASANIQYSPESLEESREAFRHMRTEHYGDRGNSI